MADDLSQLLEDGIIDEALGRLKSGKEADVWLVRHGDDVLTAKVYKDRAHRSFKNSSGYKEGRQVRNTRTQRAMDKGSRFGQAAAEDAWKSAEADALHKLHAAGVRVPRPVLFYEGVLVMELVCDAEGQPAPRLVDAPLLPEDAAAIYADLRQQAVKMLCSDLIHGDLSGYNVLLGAQGPVIIDFPQVVAAAHNSQAERYFLRDIENLRELLASADPALKERASDGPEIWRAYVRRELTPDFVPTGRMPVQAGPRPAQRAPGARPHPSRPHAQGARPHAAGPHAQGARPHAAGPHAQGARPHAARPHGERPHGPRPQRPHGEHRRGERPDGERSNPAAARHQQGAPKVHQGAPPGQHQGASRQQQGAPRQHQGAPRQQPATPGQPHEGSAGPRAVAPPRHRGPPRRPGPVVERVTRPPAPPNSRDRH